MKCGVCINLMGTDPLIRSRAWRILLEADTRKLCLKLCLNAPENFSLKQIWKEEERMTSDSIWLFFGNYFFSQDHLCWNQFPLMELTQLLFYIKEPGVLLGLFWINGRVYLKDNFSFLLCHIYLACSCFKLMTWLI